MESIGIIMAMSYYQKHCISDVLSVIKTQQEAKNLALQKPPKYEPPVIIKGLLENKK